ncbi:MAG TPA: hypothetical protein VHG10_15795 [Glycomyces sp.]|nr:hypothetical protein [Glycomyces sp.]
MQYRSSIKGVTGRVRSAAAALTQRLSNLVTSPQEHHSVIRFRDVGIGLGNLVAKAEEQRHIRRLCEAGSAAVQRLSNVVAEPHEHHSARRLAVIGIAAAVFTGTGASAAWAISHTDAPATPEVAAAEDAPEKTEQQTAAATDGAEAPTPEKAAAEETTEAEAAEAEAAEAEAAEAEAAEEEAAGPVDIDVSDIDDEQEANAVTIIETGKELGIDREGWAVALATGMQEAKLYNAASTVVPESFEYTDSDFSGSDHDSVGVFQQRVSIWGSVEELMDVPTSAGKFYNALEDVDGWENMPISEAAQSVQISAFPDAYAQWEGLAWDIIDAYEAAS